MNLIVMIVGAIFFRKRTQETLLILVWEHK